MLVYCQSKNWSKSGDICFDNTKKKTIKIGDENRGTTEGSITLRRLWKASMVVKPKTRKVKLLPDVDVFRTRVPLGKPVQTKVRGFPRVPDLQRNCGEHNAGHGLIGNNVKGHDDLRYRNPELSSRREAMLDSGSAAVYIYMLVFG